MNSRFRSLLLVDSKHCWRQQLRSTNSSMANGNQLTATKMLIGETLGFVPNILSLVLAAGEYNLKELPRKKVQAPTPSRISGELCRQSGCAQEKKALPVSTPSSRLCGRCTASTVKGSIFVSPMPIRAPAISTQILDTES